MDTLQTLIRKQGLSITAEGEAVIIRRAAVKAVVPVWGRTPDYPSPDVHLYRALVVISGYDACDDVLDWCDEYGFSPAEPGRVDQFKAIGEGRNNLIALIGEAQLDQLIMELHIGQAIDAARPR